MNDHEIKQEFDEVQSQWQMWRNEAEEDFKFYLGDQWTRGDRESLPSDYPMLTLNIIKKPIDLMVGYQRQNRTDLKAYPVEGSDNRIAELHSMLMQYTLKNRGGHEQWGQAEKDSFICGLGWVHPYICYKDDRENGNVRVLREDPFRIYPDPYMTRMDLSDAEFVMRHAYLSKNQAMQLWPDKAKHIDLLSGSEDTLKTTMPRRNFGHYDDMVNIVEKWYRKVKKINFLVDLETGDMKEISENPNKIMTQLDAQFPGRYAVLKEKVERMHLKAVAEGTLELYDDETPYGVHSMFPFIPIFSHFTPTYREWDLKVQGLVRKYKDIQREKNKRRSQAMYTTLTKNLMGYLVRDDVDIKPESFLGSMYINRASDISTDAIREITPPVLDTAQIQLEQLFDNDSIRIGENADLLGGIEGGGSAASAPGVTLQLRQRQGLTAVQEVFDNHTTAYKMLGQYHIELVNKNYSRQKIESILGSNIPYLRKKREIAKQLRQVA